MDVANELKLSQTKEILDKQGIVYFEHANGHLQIDGINLWATTEKWNDPNTAIVGRGINSFLRYFKAKI